MSNKPKIESSSRKWATVEYGWRIKRHTHAWRPPTDVCETDEAFIVDVEVAGMKSNEFTVSFEKNTLTVRGSRPEKSEPRAYHQMEIAHGEFATEVHIPGSVNTETIEANYKDGFLRVILPKQKPTSISIESDS
jgi:HSP20 family protein